VCIAPSPARDPRPIQRRFGAAKSPRPPLGPCLSPREATIIWRASWYCGSFVTSKLEPQDVDVFLVMDDTFDASSFRRRFLRSSTMRRQRTSVRGVLGPTSRCVADEQAAVEFWQVSVRRVDEDRRDQYGGAMITMTKSSKRARAGSAIFRTRCSFGQVETNPGELSPLGIRVSGLRSTECSGGTRVPVASPGELKSKRRRPAWRESCVERVLNSGRIAVTSDPLLS